MKTYTVSLRRVNVFVPFLPLAARLSEEHSFTEHFDISTSEMLSFVNEGASLHFLQGRDCAECSLRKKGRALQANIDALRLYQFEQHVEAVLFNTHITELCETPLLQTASLLVVQ